NVPRAGYNSCALPLHKLTVGCHTTVPQPMFLAPTSEVGEPLPFLRRKTPKAPIFVGTRVPVQSLFTTLEAAHSIQQFLEGFPSVKRDQVISRAGSLTPANPPTGVS